MQATILGCSPSFPHPGGASSGYLVQTDQTTILVDAGHGICSKLRAVTDLQNLDAIAITHMHPDHFFDLIPLMFTHHFTRHGTAPIPLLLPPGGIDFLIRFNAVLNEPPQFMAAAFAVREYDPNSTLEIGDVVITFAQTVHPARTFAMRFASRAEPDRALALSSDTAWSDDVLNLTRGASVGIIEASILDYS